MTPDAQQPQMEYEFACNCCENKCRVIAYNALPPDCGCIINSDCGAIWSTRPHTPTAEGITADEVGDMCDQVAEVAIRTATLATLDKIIAYRKAQSKVFGVQTAWEGEGAYILELSKEQERP